nr:meiotic recombination protein DMC1/LIM15 homolog [Lytechinus pictus]
MSSMQGPISHAGEYQFELLDYAAAKFHEEPDVFKLLIIDSIMDLFRVDFSGRGELADRQQKLAQLLSNLQKISEEYNVAVFVTNQMTSDPGATMRQVNTWVFHKAFLKFIHGFDMTEKSSAKYSMI